MLDVLVNEYLASSDCINCFCNWTLPSDNADIRDVIAKAALSTYQGKRHPHQRRISQSVLEASKDALLCVVEPITRATAFAELHHIVERAFKPIKGAGELLTYDAAQRIGAAKGIDPERVYLHAGTRVGARRLGLRGKSLEMSQLPAALQRLTPAQAEDFLCLFKDRLADCLVHKS